MLNNKTFLKILSLVIAILLWFYVVGELDPETKAEIRNIEVEFVNQEKLADNGLAVAWEGNIIITAEIKAKRTQIKSIKETGLTAHVDVSSASLGNNQGKVELVAPENVTIDSISQNEIEYTVEESEEETREVKIDFVGENTNTKDVPWAYNIYPETIMVKGTKETLQQIKYLKGNITSNVVASTKKTVDVDIIPVNEGGEEVKCAVLSDNTVSADVQLMDVRDVSLNIKPINLEEGYEITEIKGGKSIKIIGVPGVVVDIESLDATADLTNITSKGKVSLSIDLPKNVYMYSDKDKTEVTVYLKNKN